MSMRVPPTTREWWFGPVPTAWSSFPLKYLCERFSLYGANIPAELYEHEGIRFLRTTDIRDDGSLGSDGVYVPKELVANCMLADQDFLISRSGTVGRAFVYQRRHGPCSYAGYLVRYVLNDKTAARWLFYLTKSAPFIEWLGASAIEATIGNVNGEKYANLAVPVPPLAERVAMAEFLERVTAQIDELVAAKRHLLDLLAEKRKAIVAAAVTRGVESGASMRDSGVPWLGEIPMHWTVKRLKHVVFRTVDCPHSTPEYEFDGPALVVRTADLDAGCLRRDSMRRCSLATHAERSERMQLQPDDVLYSREGERFGISALVPSTESPICLGQRMMAFRAAGGTSPPFLMWALNGKPVYDQVAQDMVGATSPRVNIPTIVNAFLALPPIDEQYAIVEHIGRETAKLDAVRDATMRSIELLAERRAALIAAAVTGQLDVGAAA